MCGFNNLWCQGIEIVEGLDPFDLGKQSIDQSEVATADPKNGRDGDRVSDPTGCCTAHKQGTPALRRRSDRSTSLCTKYCNCLSATSRTASGADLSISSTNPPNPPNENRFMNLNDFQLPGIKSSFIR